MREVARDLLEKISSEGRSRAFPGSPFLGFPITESASSSRELLLAGWKQDVGFPGWAGATSPSELSRVIGMLRVPLSNQKRYHFLYQKLAMQCEQRREQSRVATTPSLWQCA